MRFPYGAVGAIFMFLGLLSILLHWNVGYDGIAITLFFLIAGPIMVRRAITGRPLLTRKNFRNGIWMPILSLVFGVAAILEAVIVKHDYFSLFSNFGTAMIILLMILPCLAGFFVWRYFEYQKTLEAKSMFVGL